MEKLTFSLIQLLSRQENLLGAQIQFRWFRNRHLGAVSLGGAVCRVNRDRLLRLRVYDPDVQDPGSKIIAGFGGERLQALSGETTSTTNSGATGQASLRRHSLGRRS